MRDHEDLSAQRAALTDARAHLSDALAHLAAEALRAHKAARTKTGQPDMPAVHGAASAVKRAEDAVDTAAYDLATASGEHG